MYYPELQSFMIQNTDPYMVRVFEAGIQVLESFEIEDYLLVFNNCFGDNQESAEAYIVDQINTKLREYLVKITHAHGVSLVDHTELSVLVQVCGGLAKLNELDQDTKNTAILILGIDQTSQETLGELLELVSGLKTENFLSYVEDISDELIDKLKELYRDPEANRLVVIEDIQPQIEAYKKFKLAFPSAIWTDKFVSNLETVGYPFESYYTALMMRITPYLDTISVISIAPELIACGCLCKESLSKIEELLEPKYEEVFLEPEKAVRLKATVRSMLPNVQSGTFYILNEKDKK